MDEQNRINQWGKDQNLQHLILGEKDKTAYMDEYDWWGYDDPQTCDQIRPHDSVGIASISKSMTAVGILSLHVESEIDLYNPIHDYINLEKKTENPVTINNLLTHTSGRPNDHSARYIIEEHLGIQNKTASLDTYEKLLSFANAVPEEMCLEPETAFFYYNTGYMLLGHLIETVRDQKYESFIRELIFEPLQMNDSCFVNESENRDDVIQHYSPKEDNEKSPSKVEINLPRTLNPAGGVISSLHDMLCYGHLIANNGRYKDQQIIPAEIFDLLKQTETENIGRPTDLRPVHVDTPVGVNTGENKYAKGIEHNSIANKCDIIGHHGDLGLSESQLTITDEKIIMSLATPAKGGRNLSNLNLEVLAGKSGDPYKQLKDILHTLSGEYQAHLPNYQINIESQGTHLTYETSNGGDGVLIPDFDPLKEQNTYQFIEPDTRQKKQHIKRTKSADVLFLDRNAFYHPRM